MNLANEVAKLREQGYSEANAEAKLCQDIIIRAISISSLNRNITIKGGVVMRSLSGSARRATQDIDLDFIKYSISEEAIGIFVEKLNCIDGIKIKTAGPIEELNHQDYKGKRVHIEVSDDSGNILTVKMDIGVHKELDIKQEEYCFDICFQEDSASVLINSKEQMIVEKLKALLRFGTRSTRYKDIFDICYLADTADMQKIREYIHTYIFNDTTIAVNDTEEIRKRTDRVFKNKTYKKHIEQSGKNWLEIPTDNVLDKCREFIYKI